MLVNRFHRRSLSLVIAFLIVAPSGLAASRSPVRARHGMVASVNGIASRVGVEIMKRGGNAVDAAVAVALALEVVWPRAGNIAGGGFMMIRMADGGAEAIDYREYAPLAATRDMYLDAKGEVIADASTVGDRSVAVPATIAGLALALQRHGTMKWADVVEPARRLAADGFVVDHQFAESFRDVKSVALLEKFDESRRIYLRYGNPPKEGEVFRQPELAATLARLQREGPRDFYEGKTARLIVDEMKRGGGLITMKDLADYRPVVRTPLRDTYRGYEILTMPLPSSGGILMFEMLHMLEGMDRAGEPGSSQDLHEMIEVERRAFADRASYLGDSDFVKVPLDELLSRDYAKRKAATILPNRATPSSEIDAGVAPLPPEHTETTHFSIVDSAGNMVSNTYTLNNRFGSGVTVHGAGFLLNDEMDDFTSKPGVPNLYGVLQSEANAITPRKRPLSSMTPTIVVKEGKPFMAIGSPGGPTIIDTVLQVIVNVIDHGMTLQEAIDAPRFHHQWMPDEVFWEPRGLNEDTRRAMESMGYRFRSEPGFIGDAEGVMIEPGTGMRLGASDGRADGVAAGY